MDNLQKNHVLQLYMNAQNLASTQGVTIDNQYIARTLYGVISLLGITVTHEQVIELIHHVLMKGGK